MSTLDATAPTITGFPVHKLEVARAALAKLHAKVARSAAKLGVSAPAAPTLTEVRRWTMYRCPDRTCPSAGASLYGGCDPCGRRAIAVEYCELLLEGDRPAIAGWTLLAVVQPLTAEGNLVKRVPGAPSDIDLTAYFAPGKGTRCDHCQTNRKRTDTFVCLHEDGTIKQVGRNCLMDFLGVDPATLVARLGWEKAIRAIGDEDELSGGWRESEVGTGAYLAMVACCIRLDGWVSKKMAEEQQRVATAQTAMSYCRPSQWMLTTAEGQKELALHTPTEADLEQARLAQLWARNLPGGNDFERNIRLVAGADLIGRRTEGFAAAIVSGYVRECGVVARANAPQGTSEWLGAPKAKVEVTVTVTKALFRQGDFGVSVWYVMVTDTGSVVTWSASKDAGLKEGDRAKVAGTVKAQSEYRGTKQTALTRCSVEKVAR